MEVPKSIVHRAGPEECWGGAGLGWAHGWDRDGGRAASPCPTLQGLIQEQDKDLDFHVKYSNCLLTASN